MNEELKKELNELRSQQKALLQGLMALDEKLQKVSEAIGKEEQTPVPAVPPPLPPSIAKVVTPPTVLPKLELRKDLPSMAVKSEFAQAPVSSPEVPVSAKEIPSAVPSPKVVEKTPEVPKQNVEKESLEFFLGQVWFIRIGVLFVLTALVFAGNEAYRHFVLKLTPMAKAIGLYVASGVLIGLGLFLERRKESLKNYSQVILAGGLAAVYYTTYASHFVAPLRWIESVAVVALLLLGCAGVMTWVADLKKSQTLGTIGLLLAYYSCVINPISWFTLLSNLLLGLAAIVLLVRNRWTICSWLALPATYGAYAYWQFFRASGDSVGGGFWLSASFLFAYWLLFTAAVFLSRQGQSGDEEKAGFLCLNNLAFYGLVVSSMTPALREHLWMFTMGFGVLLSGLGIIARVKAGEGPAVSHAYIIKGLLFITAGLFLKFSGYQLALLILIQSAVLLLAARDPFRGFLKFAAGLAAFVSLTVGMEVLVDKASAPLATGLLMTGLFVFEAWWSRHHSSRVSEEGELRVVPCYYVALGIIASLTVALVNLPFLYKAPVLAALAVLLSVSGPRLKLPELSLSGAFFLLAGFGAWIFQSIDNTLPWWNLLVVMVSSLALSFWWQGQSKIRVDQALVQIGIFFAALLSMMTFYLWLEPRWDFRDWMMYGGFLAFAGVLYALAFRNWAVGLFSQFFLVISVAHFFVRVTDKEAAWSLALLPLASVLAMNLALQELFKRKENEPSGGWSLLVLQPAVLGYRLLTLTMLLFWIHSYIPDVYLPGFLGVAGLIAGIWGLWEKNGLRLCFALLLVVIGLLYVVFDPIRVPVTRWTDLAVILAPAVLQQLSRLWPGLSARFREIEVTGILMSIGCLWLFSARWVAQVFDGFYLTVGWSVLALLIFLSGLALRERVYRLSGLFILACCLGRIVFVDLWQFGALSRIVSLMVAGAVLGLLGFIYNRYAETIKKYL